MARGRMGKITREPKEEIPRNMDSLQFVASVATAKTKTTESEGGLTPIEKKSLDKFKEAVTDSTVKAMSGMGGSRALRAAAALSLALTAACSRTVDSGQEYLSEPTSISEVSIPGDEPQLTEIQIAPPLTEEVVKNMLLTSVEVMTREEIEADSLLSDANFLEGINNYVQETREARNLSEEGAAFELVVIRGIKPDGTEMYFPFAVWIAQDEDGLNFVDMIGVAESGLVMIALERQELEMGDGLYYVLALQNVGPIFAIPASEIDNPEAEISFSPSGGALETTELSARASILLALRPETDAQEAGISDEQISELAERLQCTGLTGACFYDVRLGWGTEATMVDVISTGQIRTIDIVAPGGDVKLAEAEVAVCVTRRHRFGNPLVLNVIVQLRPADELDVNVNGLLPFLAADDLDRENAYSLEELEEIFREGRQLTFALTTRYSEEGSKKFDDIMREMYSDEEYLRQLSELAEGSLEPDVILVVLPITGHTNN